MKKLISALLLSALTLLIQGCGSTKLAIAEKASGPKDLYVNLTSDPLLISIELKTYLETNGYNIALSSEESAMAVKVKKSDGTEILHNNVSHSKNRYELILGYSPIQDRVLLIVASVRDRKENKILGTWRWSWSRMAPAPTVDEAVAMIDEELLSKVFSR